MTTISKKESIPEARTRQQQGLRLWLPGSEGNSTRLIALGVLLSIIIFLLDLLFRRGVAAGVPYVLVVLLGLWIPERRIRFSIACGVSVLAIVGFFLPFSSDYGDGLTMWIGIENRMIALTSIWITTALVDIALMRNAQVAEREGRLRAVLHAAIDAVLILDEDGRVVTCNPAASDMFQHHPENLEGLSLKQLISLPRRPENGHTEDGFRILDFQHEAQASRKDGSTLPVDVSFSEVRLKEGQLYAGILRDITERKETERRLLQSESLAAIGEAITGLAHESRNALQRTQACVELLGDCVTDDAEAQALVRDIQEAQDELNYLYEKVRTYASPRPLQAHSCRVQELIEDVWQSLKSEYAGRDARLLCEGPARGMVIEADTFAIKQLFRNLLENALAACADPVELRVELRATTLRAQPALEICVQDNGPGIPPEQAECVFEPFFTTKIRGTGLGLAICKRIVDDHGGEIRLEPSNRMGAKFLVTLRQCLN